MAENAVSALVGGPYQGNVWWTIGALLSLFTVYRTLTGARSRHKFGFPVDVRTTIFVCIVALTFFAAALFQVLTHPW
jgi:uncharacterized membrane protein YfcA